MIPILLLCGWLTSPPCVPGVGGEVKKAEQLTEAEIGSLRTARQKVFEAQKAAQDLERKIATAHGMACESWMEWQSWYEFSGDFILQRFHSSMWMEP